MGSGSSQIELPPGSKIVSIQEGGSKKPRLAQRTKDGGFKEVQFEQNGKADTDFHSMVHQMQREKTEVGYEQPEYVSIRYVCESMDEYTFHKRTKIISGT